MTGWLRPADAARHAGVHVRTIRRWREREGLPASVVGGVVLIHRRTLDEWIRDREEVRASRRIAANPLLRRPIGQKGISNGKTLGLDP